MQRREDHKAFLLDGLRSRKNRPFIVAHRGCSGRAPENTLSAFELALKLGADMLECDVRLSRDGEVVVFHDRNLNRTTNGKGPLEEHTLDQLKQLDAGSWFDRNFSGERIPTLGQVLELIEDRSFLIIELKANPPESQSHLCLQERVVQVIHERRAEQRVFLGSFNHRLMRELKQRHPELNTGIIYKAVRDLGRRPSRLVSRAMADAFVCGRWWVSRKFLHDLDSHGIPLFVYTVNRTRDAERLARLNVAGIITNYPDVVKKALDGISPG
jgi:glycerophosphoryl diester phosphodiesterase